MNMHQNRTNNRKKPARLTPEVLQALQTAMSDVIKPEYNKEKGKDGTKKKHRNKNKKVNKE
jgi:hypothetical protein